MHEADLLRSFGIDPAVLDPAPPWTPCGSAAIERLRGRFPCLGCDAPSTVADTVTAAGLGRRWVDLCMPCLIAATPRSGAQAPLEDTLGVLRDAAREVGVALTVVTDGA
ncbi:hypothetical protein [Streptomyces sp. NPDC005780]|uniref:hypothetical protein n=1 Tax=Streptomyces sp. NPDC005780 TaxID=3364730 RepID=UPI0036C7E4E3